MNHSPDNPFYKLKVRYLFWQFVVISFAIAFVQGIVQEATREKFDSQALTLVVYVAIVISLSLWTWIDFVRAGVNLKCLVGNIPRNYKWLSALGLVLLMIIFSISAYLVSFTAISYIAPTFIESVLRQAANDPGPSIAAPLFQNLLGIITYVVVAPVTEEFLFRGFILQRWAVKWGIRSALVVSSVLFGFLHANVVGLTLFGLIMGVLYIKTRSLIVPIVCHAFNNLIASGMGFLSGQAETTTKSAVNSLEQLRSGWWVGILLMCISLPFLLRFLKRNWPQKDTRVPYLINVQALET